MIGVSVEPKTLKTTNHTKYSGMNMGDAFEIYLKFEREYRRSRLMELRNLAQELALRGYITWDEFNIIDRIVREKLKEMVEETDKP